MEMNRTVEFDNWTCSIGTSQVGHFCHIHSGTVIGNGVKIGSFVELSGVTIKDNLTIGSHSFIKDSVIRKDVPPRSVIVGGIYSVPVLRGGSRPRGRPKKDEISSKAVDFKVSSFE